jgi:CrcB protein
MARFLWICLGGALGTGARYAVSGWAQKRFGPSFPYGTLTVNLLGSFLIAALMHLGLTTAILSPEARMILAIGVLGGFTTYSTFNYETMRYFQDGAWTLALANVFVMVTACLVASLAGLAAARWLVGG